MVGGTAGTLPVMSSEFRRQELVEGPVSDYEDRTLFLRA
jgi:hypothetical protein